MQKSNNIYAPKSGNPEYLRGYRTYLEVMRNKSLLGYRDETEEFKKGFRDAIKMRENAHHQGYCAHSDASRNEDVSEIPPDSYKETWGRDLSECLGYNPWQDFVEGWQAAHKKWLRGTWGHKTKTFEARERITGEIVLAIPTDGGFDIWDTSLIRKWKELVPWREFDKRFDPV